MRGNKAGSDTRSDEHRADVGLVKWCRYCQACRHSQLETSETICGISGASAFRANVHGDKRRAPKAVALRPPNPSQKPEAVRAAVAEGSDSLARLYRGDLQRSRCNLIEGGDAVRGLKRLRNNARPAPSLI
ncbi:hypothetical protein SKAU_G00185850 [Synaphobranchus kaupii]|uniref:Uncharacterized protein n=1 Tax=Synaphobranchus kaupii TaxID=118154 RepID=A0A9Q1FCR4_SYNKA|nr:hypothetical protein SKAU_G00185850 [Synaphobranchus kaupii]